MALREELEQKHEGSEVLQEFDHTEGVALVELGNLVLLIDAELTNKEHDALKERVFRLTLADDDDDVDILDDGRLATVEQFQALADDDAELDRFIQERAKAIEGEEHRRAALRVLGTLSYSDGIDEDEEGICHDIGRAFDLDEETIDDLLVEGAVDVWELGGSRVD